MLCDFGLAAVAPPGAPDRCLSRCCGSPLYVAPEVLRCARDKTQLYGRAVDAWSLGVVACLLLCGAPPFFAESRTDLEALIAEGDVDMDADPDWDAVSDAGKAFVKALLSKDPSKRPTCAEAARHAFVLEGRGEDRDLLSPQICAKLDAFNSRRRLKGGMLAVDAVVAWSHAGDKKKRRSLALHLETGGRTAPVPARQLVDDESPVSVAALAGPSSKSPA